MKLINQQDNPAVLSNVGEIGEFRIRNSAKAFNILSSGLYANKIRAIIRELSCNAVDSHVAAGKAATPFDVHLPNQLEPWFAVRDYGLGLNHDQVTNIYTTYFESTKTESNEFIGALGLGSKSPFSYTDNFTVTAVKDGRRGIYSAFINQQGVPSIALMMEEQTQDPNGVEVKFAVTSAADYSKFVQEAREVYSHFKLRPVVSGSHNWSFYDVKYIDKDIVPGVHTIESSGYHSFSRAVMGNISYKIDVPNVEKNLGNLANLLNCSLEMHFEIGELDFQASREGLSYIPHTIEAIKKRLEELNAVLMVKLAEKANKIDNLWERAIWLRKQREQQLWRASVEEYVKTTNFPLIENNHYFNLKSFELYETEIAEKYNISLRVFKKDRGHNTIHAYRLHSNWDEKGPNGQPIVRQFTSIAVSGNMYFVKNDLKSGVFARTKHHMRVDPNSKNHYESVYAIMSPVDATKPADYDRFLKSIYNPPMVILASNLAVKPREARTSKTDVSIMKLEKRNSRKFRRYDDGSRVWRDAGKLEEFDDNNTYYYLPLTGFQTVSEYGEMDNKEFFNQVQGSGIAKMHDLTLYGVRKQDLESVKTRKNWINIEEHVKAFIEANQEKIERDLVMQTVENCKIYLNADVQKNVSDKNSEFLVTAEIFGFTDTRNQYNEYHMGNLFRRYLKHAPKTEDMRNRLRKQERKAHKKYPLLKYLSSADAVQVAEYVNMVDQVKKSLT